MTLPMKRILAIAATFFLLLAFAPAQAQTVGDVLKNKSKEAGTKAKDKAKKKVKEKAKKAAKGDVDKAGFGISEKGEGQSNFGISEPGETKSNFGISEPGTTNGNFKPAGSTAPPAPAPEAPKDSTQTAPQPSPLPNDSIKKPD